MSARRAFCLLAFGLTVACGKNQTDQSIENGTSSPSEEVQQWTSVHYRWRSAWVPCTDNQFAISRKKQASSRNCGEVTTATISNEDFSSLETALAPVLQNFNESLKCTNEVIMDWSVYTYLSVGSKTKKMYSFDQDQNCARGERAAVEQLQETLEILDHKYFPRD